MPVNNGNQIMRWAITDDLGDHPDRFKLYVRITNNARSTCYQQLEPMPPLGSGSPSCLHKLNEVIEAVEMAERQEGATVSYADMLADYSREYLDELRGGVSLDTRDAIAMLCELNCNVSDVMQILKGRFFHELNLNELGKIRELTMRSAALEKALVRMVNALIGEKERSATGSPIQREHLRATG